MATANSELRRDSKAEGESKKEERLNTENTGGRSTEATETPESRANNRQKKRPDQRVRAQFFTEVMLPKP
jgi:hypothetical protein